MFKLNDSKTDVHDFSLTDSLVCTFWATLYVEAVQRPPSTVFSDRL